MAKAGRPVSGKTKAVQIPIRPEVKKYIQIFAVQNDLSMIEAVEEVVAESKKWKQWKKENPVESF